MFSAIIRRLPSRKDRGGSTAPLPPRAPAAASSEAQLSSSSVAARDTTVVSVASGRSKASGSTSSSGISSSTTYTSSRGSALSPEPGLQLLRIDDDEKAKWRERAFRLEKEFYHGDGDIAALKRWLSDMGVGWVPEVADDPSAGTSLLRDQHQRNNLTEKWIRALNEITESIPLESLHSHYLISVKGSFPDKPSDISDKFVRAIEATVLNMLSFVDALLAATDLDASNGAQAPSEKLQALLGVRDAVYRASRGIRLCFQRNSLAEMDAQRSKLLALFSEKQDSLDEAIWNTMEEVRTGCILNDDNEWGIQTSQGSPDICKVTRSLMTYIKTLWNNYSRLNCIVAAAAELGTYVPNRDIISSFLLSMGLDKADPYTTLTLEMVSSLDVKLAKRSESFQDHSLRFLFLINNTHFIQQQLHSLFHINYHTQVLIPKIEDYIQKYVQASWAPVMSCLNNDNTPHCFRKDSALPEFYLEFEKTYRAQKLWKVPDPELRTRLRKAIIKEVVPGLTKYLEDNKITSPGVTSQEREEMLLDLFEG